MATPAKKKDTGEHEEQAAQPKKSKLKVVIFIILLLLLGIGGGGAATFFWFNMRSPGSFSSGASSSTGDPSTASDRPVQPTGNRDIQPLFQSLNIVPLPTVTVNLADAAADRYLRLAVEVEVSAPEAVREIQEKSARIRDAIIILLSSKTYADLSPAEGKMQLKNELAARINQILGTPRIIRVYYTEFTIN